MLNWKRGLLAGLGASLIVTGLVLGAESFDVRAEEPPKNEEVKIDDQNFPDFRFRKFIAEQYDLDQNGILNEYELKAVEEMFVETSSIKDLKGIEFFTEITFLTASPGEYGSDPEQRGSLKSIDVSKNTKLTGLVVAGNKLTKLDLSNNPELIYLDCSCNLIKDLDISKNTRVVTLDFDFNYVGGSLDLNYMPELESLRCLSNNLTALDVSKNTRLTELSCGQNPFTELKMDGLTELISLDCHRCELSGKLDLSKSTKLECIECGWNEITELVLGEKPELVILEASNNKLSKIDLPKMTKFGWLDVSVNEISELDLSNVPELLIIRASSNKLTSLDLSKNPKLVDIECDGNKIPELDISAQKDVVDMVKTTERETTDDGLAYYYYKDMPIEEDTLISFSYWYLQFSKDTEIVYKDSEPTPVPQKSIGDFVERLYTVALDREAEEDGKKYWVDEITSGRKTGGDCGLFFLTGAEFMNRKISVEDFVETLYKTFFDRASEAEGKAYWVGVLKNGGDRNAVVKGFIDSKEWCNICADYGVRSGAPTAKAERASKNASDFATRLYICCLGRDPEEAGLKYWALALTNLEQTGATAAKEFFGSEEFKNLKLGDEEFLTRLYTTFMDREPEPEGLKFWLGQLQGGATREQVLAQFVSSVEFTEICAKYGIERGTI